MDTVDLLLHPVRLRIVHALSGGRTLTTTELSGRLPEVSKVTVYRQVALLAEGGFLEVAGERRREGGDLCHEVSTRPVSAPGAVPGRLGVYPRLARAPSPYEMAHHLHHLHDVPTEVCAHRANPSWSSPRGAEHPR